MRKHLIIASLLVLVAAACSDASSSSTDPTTTTSLVVSTTSTSPPTTAVVAPPDFNAQAFEVWVPAAAVEAIQVAADSFEIDTGVGIEITAIEYDEMLAALLADPTAGPAAFIGPHTWLTALTDAGIAEPLAPRSEVAAGAVASVTLRSTVFAAPLGLDTTVQFRNTTRMPIAPIAVESLATGCPDGDGVGPCLLIPLDSVDGQYPFLASLGGYVFGPDPYEGWDADDVGVDTPEAVAGVRILESLVDGGSTLGDGNSSVHDRFLAGEAPLLWGGLDSLERLTELGARFVVEPLPTIGGQLGAGPVRTTAVWVNAFSDAKVAAAAFVSEYLVAPGTGGDIAIALDSAPVNISFDADPALQAFVQAARTGQPVPTIFQTDYAWEQLAAAFSQIRSGDDVDGALLDAAVAIRDAPEPPQPEAESEG